MYQFKQYNFISINTYHKTDSMAQISCQSLYFSDYSCVFGYPMVPRVKHTRIYMSIVTFEAPCIFFTVDSNYMSDIFVINRLKGVNTSLISKQQNKYTNSRRN